MNRWTGKVAVVTGASAGIGAAIAEELVKKGMNVVGIARRVERLEEMKQKLTVHRPATSSTKPATDTVREFQYIKENLGNLSSRGGSIKKPDPIPWGKFYPLKADLSKEEDIIKAFEWIKTHLGKVHVLVNNAGIARFGNIFRMENDYLKQVIDVNLLAMTTCSKLAVKLMEETGVNDGHIILMNSIGGHYVPSGGNRSVNIYPASKHAITGLTEIMRQDLQNLKTKIRVTSISPGHVESEIFDASMASQHSADDDKGLAEMVKSMPTLYGKDIADAVVFVLSTPAHVQVHELMIRPVGEFL